MCFFFFLDLICDARALQIKTHDRNESERENREGGGGRKSQNKNN